MATLLQDIPNNNMKKSDYEILNVNITRIVKLLILIEGNNILMCLLTYTNLNKSINILIKL